MRRAPRPARSSRRRYHHGDLRRALIDAALDAVAGDGVEALNLRDLARRLGVSPGAPYRHFADKEALLVALAGEVAARFADEVARAQAAAPPDPLSQYRAVGIAQVLFAHQHPAHFRAMHRPGVADRLAAGELGAGQEALRVALAAAQRRGELADLPLDDIMLAATSLTHGLAHLIVDGHPALAGVDRARAEALAVAVTSVLGCGLLPRPTARSSRTGAARRRRG